MCHLAPVDDDKNMSHVLFSCMVFPTSPIARIDRKGVEGGKNGDLMKWIGS